MTVSMILNELDAESLVCEWVAAAAESEAAQLRKEPRFPFVTPATITHDGMKTYAICRDISQKGVGIIQSGSEPKAGPAMLSISIRKQLVYLDVKVSWRKKLGCGWWASGGDMIFSSIDYASMMLLRMSNAVERRVHRRHSFCQVFFVYPSLELEDDCVGIENLPREKGVLAISLDVSSGGMRLMIQEPIKTTSQYIYLRTQESQGSSYLIRCQIVSQRDLGDRYRMLGLKFVF